MEITVTARHFDLTAGVKKHVEEKVSKLGRYDDALQLAEVILSVEKHGQNAEIVLHGNGFNGAVHVESADMYEAIDRATQKAEVLVKRHREKVYSVRRRQHSRKKGREIDGIVKAGEDGEAMGEESLEG